MYYAGCVYDTHTMHADSNKIVFATCKIIYEITQNYLYLIIPLSITQCVRRIVSVIKLRLSQQREDILGLKYGIGVSTEFIDSLGLLLF